jgi:hypothetical protein
VNWLPPSGSSLRPPLPRKPLSSGGALEGVAFAQNTMAERCREGALRGFWLLAAEASETEVADYREAVLEVLAHTDPAMAQVVSASIDRDHGMAPGDAD